MYTPIYWIKEKIKYNRCWFKIKQIKISFNNSQMNDRESKRVQLAPHFVFFSLPLFRSVFYRICNKMIKVLITHKRLACIVKLWIFEKWFACSTIQLLIYRFLYNCLCTLFIYNLLVEHSNILADTAIWNACGKSLSLKTSSKIDLVLHPAGDLERATSDGVKTSCVWARTCYDILSRFHRLFSNSVSAWKNARVAVALAPSCRVGGEWAATWVAGTEGCSPAPEWWRRTPPCSRACWTASSSCGVIRPLPAASSETWQVC